MEHRSRRRGADRFDRLFTQLREEAHGVQIRMLALARAHAHRGIALQQLAAVESFLEGIGEVAELEVFVEVDELLALRMREHRIGMRGTAAR